jgi:hypothetical protein
MPPNAVQIKLFHLLNVFSLQRTKIVAVVLFPATACRSVRRQQFST